MSLSSILNSPPKVHNWGAGELTATGLPKDVFEFMDRVLTSDSASVETGIGISTAVFAFKGGKHTCIAPDQNEYDRLKEYSDKHGISLDNITFLAKCSYEAWFDLKDARWDFVLIDGLHGFPAPFMDWYFLSQGLSVNGYLIIDDTHISTGKVLKDFLLKEDAWKIVGPLSQKTAIFQKVSGFNYNKEFVDQPYVVKQTKAINKHKKLRQFLGSVKRKLKKIVNVNNSNVSKFNQVPPGIPF